MNRIRARVMNLYYLIRNLHFTKIFKKIAFRAYSDSYAYCLRRDLSRLFIAPRALFSITVRPIEQKDFSLIFGAGHDRPIASPQELWEQRSHIHANIRTCYVAVLNDGTPVNMQWVLYHTENQHIETYFNGIFPKLAEDEMLVESGLTFREYRKKGIMIESLDRLAAIGAAEGIRYMYGYVGQANIPSLKGFRSAGFEPYMLRHERWRLFIRRLTFTKVPATTLFPFEIAGVGTVQ